MHIPYIKFQDPIIRSLTILDHMQSVTDTQTDPNQYAPTTLQKYRLNFGEADVAPAKNWKLRKLTKWKSDKN